MVGQSRTTVDDTFGAGRSRHTVRTGAKPNCDLASHALDTPRTNKVTGCAPDPAHAHQGLCCTGNEGSCGARTSADRTSGRTRRGSRRPIAVIFSPLWLLGR